LIQAGYTRNANLRTDAAIDRFRYGAALSRVTPSTGSQP
jgi:hypothetical protein